MLFRSQDPELGEILFHKNSRAKRYIIRCKKGAVNVTVPWRGSLKEAESFLHKNRSKIIPIIQEMKERAANNKQSISPDEIALLKEKAVDFLPGELEKQARDYGFQYKSCKIGKSKTHWGSCSSSGTIRLSLYIMLLPKNLIQYILLHELCHTVHHNHGEHFWALLNKCTNDKAKQLRGDLRKYPIPH